MGLQETQGGRTAAAQPTLWPVCPWYHGRTMLMKSFSLIQPECKLGRNEDRLGLKAANTFNPMLLTLQPNKIRSLGELTRPKPWAQLLNSIKNETLVWCHKAGPKTSSQGRTGLAQQLGEVVAIG